MNAVFGSSRLLLETGLTAAAARARRDDARRRRCAVDHRRGCARLRRARRRHADAGAGAVRPDWRGRRRHPHRRRPRRRQGPRSRRRGRSGPPGPRRRRCRPGTPDRPQAAGQRHHLHRSWQRPGPGRRRPRTDGVRIEIDDTGAGVSAEAVAHLFEAFVQADTSTTRKHGGCGLGLAICRRLAEAMGGTIGVDSVAGGGLAVLGRPAAGAGRRGAVEAPPPFAGRRAVVLCTARATRRGARCTSCRRPASRSPWPTPPTGVLDHLAANVGTDLLVLDLRVDELDALAMRLASAALSTVPQAVLVLAPTLERQALPAVFATSAVWLPRPLLRRPAARDARARVPPRRRRRARRSDGRLRARCASSPPTTTRPTCASSPGCSRSAATRSRP